MNLPPGLLPGGMEGRVVVFAPDLSKRETLGMLSLLLLGKALTQEVHL